MFYEFLKCGLYNTYNTFCLIQWTNVRAHNRWAVSANCLRHFGPVRDIRFVKLVPHCVLPRTHDGRWCNGRWCRMVPTVDWQFNAGCAVRSLQLAATSCSLQHAQLYSCTHGRVLYVVLYIRIIQTFYTHSSIVVTHPFDFQGLSCLLAGSFLFFLGEKSSQGDSKNLSATLLL